MFRYFCLFVVMNCHSLVFAGNISSAPLSKEEASLGRVLKIMAQADYSSFSKYYSTAILHSTDLKITHEKMVHAARMRYRLLLAADAYKKSGKTQRAGTILEFLEGVEIKSP